MTDPRQLPPGSVDALLTRAFASLDADEHCDVTVFEGVARFPQALVGPPGRLHGGLHLAARTVSVLAALDRHAEAPLGPMRIEAALGKAIPLETDVPFDGALVTNGDAFTLETRFLGSPKLVANARARTSFEAPEAYDDAAREALALALAAPAHVVEVFGLPFHVGEDVVHVGFDVGCHTPTHELTRYLREDGKLGATWLCATLDTVAACGLGLAWRTHLFTTHGVVELGALPIAHDEPLVAISWLARATPVTDSGMQSVTIRGVPRATTRVPILLVRKRDLAVLAHGVFDLHPVDASRAREGLREG